MSIYMSVITHVMYVEKITHWNTRTVYWPLLS